MDLDQNFKIALSKLVMDVTLSKACSDCEMKKAYSYLFGTVSYDKFLLDRPVPELPPYIKQDAQPLYDEWVDTEKYVSPVKGRKAIPSPDRIKKDMTLIEFLRYLAKEVHEKNEKRCNWIKSIWSFRNYLLEDMPDENRGILDWIFPYEKELRSDYIFRKTEKGIEKVQITHILRSVGDEEYPIDVLAYSEIVQNLIIKVLEGRDNAQLNAAKALGFTWLCFISSRTRLKTELNYLHQMPSASLRKEVSNNEIESEQYSVMLKSLFGDVKVQIPKITYELLVSLSQERDGIFSSSLPSLRRSFMSAVEKSKRSAKLGPITFRTMTSFPHEAVGHRSSNRKTSKK